MLTWHVTKQLDLLALLPQLIPYLRIKRDKAVEFMEILERNETMRM